MKNKLIRTLLLWALICFIIYLLFAFVKGSFNAFEWPEHVRAFCAMFFGIGYFLAATIVDVG